MANPIKKDYIPLGEGKGIRVTLWPNSLALERVEKKEGDWETTQEITLASKVMEYLTARLPGWITLMDAREENED